MGLKKKTSLFQMEYKNNLNTLMWEEMFPFEEYCLLGCDAM
jgi:hypothetical protein